MKGQGKWHITKHRQNYLCVLRTLQERVQISARDIEKQLRSKLGDKAPNLRTIYRVLHEMEGKAGGEIARKEGRRFVYMPYYSLRDRMLEGCEDMFRLLVAYGYDVDWFNRNYGIVITPRNKGFAPAGPESLKQLIDNLYDNSTPEGGVILRIRTAGPMEKGAEVFLVPKDKAPNDV